MKIDSSSIAMASQRSYSKTTTKSETLRAWVGDRPDFNNSGQTKTETTASPKISISDAAKLLAQQAMQQLSDSTRNAQAASNKSSQNQAVGSVSDAMEELRNDPKIKLLVSIIEKLTGRKFEFFNDNAAIKQPPAENQPVKAGWGIEYDYHESTTESETTTYNANGIIKTADGKTLSFNIDLEMSRSFASSTNISVRAGDGIPKDPLVINFDGTAAELSNSKFSFDIDADGSKEDISFVSSASGFLALDKNGNGKIDDGSELFGTKSGNGFADLAAYDDDGNGWIDENDHIFASLRIWTKDNAGNDKLATLKDHGIGALYLGNASTQFSLNDTSNVQHGQIQSTGVYVKENGTIGTMQQIDLYA